MKKAILVATLPLALPFLCARTGVELRADDFNLKDGTRISGTIVGFDDDSFKVQTSYGFAMIRKDQVLSISVGDSGTAPASSPSAWTKAPPPATPAASKESAKSTPPAEKTEPKKLDATLAEKPGAKPASSSPPDRASAPASVAPSAAASAAPTESPKPPAPPEAIREAVDGTTYTNLTYGFSMYKPPSWKVIEGARSLMPGAITAMGTLDETTYLMIGQMPAGKSFTGDVESADQRLRGLMENFRSLGESKISVSGTQGIERKFRGSLDQKDWSGTVVYFVRGGQLYTIFGMTVADTDLVQIQENVISRAIASLQFAQ